MTDGRSFVVPAVLLAGIVGYVALNPAGAHVEPLPEPTPTATERPTNTPWPTQTPSATATPFPAELQLSGLSGTLTYQSMVGLVSVEFPSGDLVDPPPMEEDSWNASPDGHWIYETDCDDSGLCGIRFRSADRQEAFIPGRYRIWQAAWGQGAKARTFAVSVSAADDAAAQQLLLIDDPGTPVARIVYDAGDGDITAFAWSGGEVLVAETTRATSRLHAVRTDGSLRRTLGEFASPVPYFHASPDVHTFAFTASDPGGWRLFTFDSLTDAVTDRGAMGSDGPGGVPVTEPPESVKGPMYIAWSPDGSRLAFGGGFDAPYSMTVLDLETGATVRTPFDSGYPGEMRWSPDGMQIAVSTYDIERTHHETWVVDPVTGAGMHLMDGCVIVWSPDSRFLAVHGEDVPGIAIVEAATGARMQLTANSADAPLTWTE